MIQTLALPRRDEMPLEHTWDLGLMYADVAAWEADRGRLEALLPGLAELAGTLSEEPSRLRRALELRDEAYGVLSSLLAYANQLKDSDSTVSESQALFDRASSLRVRVQSALSFLEPEILAIPAARLAAWVQAEPGLRVYERALSELDRQRAHVRSAEVEAVLAEFGDLSRAPSEIYGILTNADLRFPTVRDERGDEVQVSHARFRRLVESPDRGVRQAAFKAYFGGFQGVLNTLGTTLAAELRSHAITARLRGYGSSLEAALGPRDIPPAVYHQLIATVTANLPQLHRYLDLRRRILGLDELRYYDLYAPLVPQVELEVPYAEARATVGEALGLLGETYGQGLGEAFANRWIDVYENVGKRSGAYSGGGPNDPPYILLNYQDRLGDMFTLAHELGHSLHSYFTRAAQPLVYRRYTIFVAEVASTLNEVLLTEHLLETRRDPALRRQLIVQEMEDIRATIFRQTMFAEFELELHRRTESGEGLTPERMNEAYREIVGRYLGPGLTLDDEVAFEWARVPHFYFNFYVFQYATGLSAALALARGIRSEGQPAVERYLTFLRSGASRSSIDLLRDAGVDMTSPAPVQAAMDRFGELLDELERDS